MSKRLSEIMSDSSRAIADAQDVLDESITNAIHIHFDAGITTERERIIKLLEGRLTGCGGYECETCDEVSGIIRAIALIKGENK